MAAIDLSTLFALDDKVAVVTGGSSGLGERFVRVLHSAGARVVAAARRTDRLEALAESLPGLQIATCDVAVRDDAERLISETVSSFGRVDVLVNNAGIGQPYPAEHEPLEHFERVLEVNVTGLFSLCQIAGRQMIEQGHGSIVNVASMLGLVASTPIKQASYCASKGAVVNLTRELGAQWGRKGVRVNAIAPGWFPSEMTAEMFGDESAMDFLRRTAPMARGGEDHELDGVLVFLCSDASSYCTGQTLVVDGGWTAR